MHRPSDLDVNWMGMGRYMGYIGMYKVAYDIWRESHPLSRLKNPTVISIWLLVGFHPATQSVQSTPADNTRKRVWQYIEKERKKERNRNQECKTQNI